MSQDPVGPDERHPGRWWHGLEDGRIQCDLCPRFCKLHEGQRGACFVRARADNQMVLTTYGRSSGFCVDPIEKKPLNHFHPGSAVLSFGTAGCNLACKFCFSPDTWIATSVGMRRIEDLYASCHETAPLEDGSVGFPAVPIEVTTREARPSRVAKVFRRPFSGELVRLKAACCPPIRATPNHGIFAAHRDDLRTIRKVQAGDLTLDHYLVVPKRFAGTAEAVIRTKEWLGGLDSIPHRPQPRRFEPAALAQMLRMDGTSGEIGAAMDHHPGYAAKLRGPLARGVPDPPDGPKEANLTAHGGRVRFRGEKGVGCPESLPLTGDLAWLLGVFCAKGMIRANRLRPDCSHLSFRFGPHEDEFVARTARSLTEIFGVHPLIVPQRTATTVEIGTASLACLFESLCGRGAADRQVPPPVLAGPVAVMRAFLEGCLAGDGYGTRTHRACLTVSERLALGLFELGLHCGGMPTYFEHTAAAAKVVDARTVRPSRLHIVRYVRHQSGEGFQGRPGRHVWRETDEHYLAPLRCIDREPYSGPVYNLEVEDPDHSYLAPFVAVANCQNWDISKSRDMDRLMDRAGPQAIAEAAGDSGCASVAFTYNDPVIFAEYAIDVARACRERGVQTVAVTAGYITPDPRREFYAVMDAANVDLKGFTDDFYVKLTGAHLDPVLDTLKYLRHETDVWFEITTLLIPGRNDSPEEVRAMSRWIMRELGPDVPLHFTAFHPDFKMTDLAPTPAATLTRSRRIAREEGLHYVYTGNVHDREGGTTYCPNCAAELIVRDWHRILDYRVTESGTCPQCGTVIAGRFGSFEIARQFGRRRIPIGIGR